MAERGPTTISITTGTILSAIGIGILVWLLFFLKGLVLIVLTAIVLASAVEPGVRWFVKHRFPRLLAVISVYVLTLGTLFAIAYFFFPPLLEEMRGFFTILPQYLNSFNINDVLVNNLASVANSATPHVPSITNSISKLQSVFTATGTGAFRALSGFFGGIISFVLIVVLSFYFAAQETGVDDFIKVVVPAKHQAYTLSLWKRSHHKIGRWMQGQLVLSFIMGILAFLWLTILGVPYGFVLAFVAAFAELIPIFGPIVAGVAAVAVALTSSTFTTALFVAGGFLVLHQLESHLIYPLVVKKVVGVPPLLVILALIAGGQLAGFLGILLSVPVAAALQEFVTDVGKARQRELARLKQE